MTCPPRLKSGRDGVGGGGGGGIFIPKVGLEDLFSVFLIFSVLQSLNTEFTKLVKPSLC